MMIVSSGEIKKKVQIAKKKKIFEKRGELLGKNSSM